MFTEFKSQFEKLKLSQLQKKEGASFSDTYQVSIMYDQYYVRKKEIAENILMIVICDTIQDGQAQIPSQQSNDQDLPSPFGEIKAEMGKRSSFNVGHVDGMFDDF